MLISFFVIYFAGTAFFSSPSNPGIPIMVVFPNCKINLGLNIIGKRSDGYHALETVFYPLQLCDALEIINNNRHHAGQTIKADPIDFSLSGLPVEGDAQKNICVNAYQLLRKDFPQLPAVQIHLHKAIPTGAGLGGGSSDGSFTLMLLNKKFELGLTDDQLSAYALQLGSDCPFFIVNKPCVAAGRGEILNRINLDLSPYKFVIVYPGIHINTSRAFAGVTPLKPAKSIREVILQPVSTWKHELRNDFEESIFSQHPEIKNLKQDLYGAGAVYASMSGSGSALYGIFEKDKKIQLSLPGHFFVRESGGCS